MSQQANGAPTAAETYAPEASMTLTGTFGSAEPPRIVSFVPYDIANADPTFNDGDGFEIVFDVYTTESGALPTKQSVDAILGFTSSLGTSYSGLWSDCADEEAQTECRKLTITVLDAAMGEGELPPLIGRTLAWVKPPDGPAGRRRRRRRPGGVGAASQLEGHPLGLGHLAAVGLDRRARHARRLCGGRAHAPRAGPRPGARPLPAALADARRHAPPRDARGGRDARRGGGARAHALATGVASNVTNGPDVGEGDGTRGYRTARAPR